MRFVAAGLLLSAIACERPPAPEPTASPLADSSRLFLEEAVRDGRVAGAVALVSRGTELVFLGAEGFADREAGIPMTTDSLFRIASMTKPITSVAVMMLHEEGRFGLDDPVSGLLPELAELEVLDSPGSRATHPSPTEITIRQLLSHTSGFSYRFIGLEPIASIYEELGVPDGLAQVDGTLEETIDKLGRAPLLHEPGASWSYGLSVDVLGRLVEVVSGQALDVFFHERIFEPLGMTDSYFFLPEEKVERLAAVYRWTESAGLERLPDELIVEGHLEYSTDFHYRGPTSYFSGGAGLVSSIRDYFRFARMLEGGGELDGARLLQPETVAMMTSNQIGDLSLDDGSKFGLGFSVRTSPGELGGRGTFGWGGFFHTRLWIDPENELIGIFMSQLRPDDAAVHEDFTRAVYEALD